MKTLSLASLLLLVLVASFATVFVTGQMAICGVDSDCGVDAISPPRGVCVNGFCSCKSGFGGATCIDRPNATCVFGPVSSTSGSFSTVPTLNYLHPSLTLTVDANIQESSFLFPALNDSANAIPYSAETTIIFGDGTHTDCNFPNGGATGIAWNDLVTGPDCKDTYSVNMPWTTAKSACGFADGDGDRIYETTITVSRKYVVETLRGEPVTRVDSSTHLLKIVFPTEVTVGSSNVQVTGSPSLLAVISLIDFDPELNEWTVKFRTSIQAPFKLANPEIDSISGGLDSSNRYKTGSLEISDISACNNNSNDCMQEGTVKFVKGTSTDACDALSGGLTALFALACQEGSTASCPLVGGETATLALNLATGNACPAVDTITFDVTTLAAYSDDAASIPRTSFITNQVAYFGAVITSDNAAIINRTLQAGSVCFQIGAGACTPVESTELSPASGKEPVFSVDLSSPANAAVFAALDTGAASAQFYQVKATIDVLFVGGTSKRSEMIFSSDSMKRSVKFNRNIALRTGLNVESASAGNIEEEMNSANQKVPASIAMMLAMIVMFILHN